MRITVRPVKTYDECGSLFFPEASRMVGVCPVCSHRLYGYLPCPHTFVDGRCSRCHWDGSVSEDCSKRKRQELQEDDSA
ncbi:MAG: hypothetical protein DYG89_49815 [Caldilinea sp. CFX5]|nr:hypothetical protein [Caldilinea sp. CFX5]